MKTIVLAMVLFAGVAIGKAAAPSRYYYEEANEAKFDAVRVGMSVADVDKICGGHPYLPFETIRQGFAFAVDEKRSGILSLPWHIDLNQMVDFFTSKKRVLVVFYKGGKADGLMVFDFAKGQWENRSRPKVPPDKTKAEPAAPA